MNTCIDSPTGRVPRNCTRTSYYNCRGSRSSSLPKPKHKQDNNNKSLTENSHHIEPITVNAEMNQSELTAKARNRQQAREAMRGKTCDWCHAQETVKKQNISSGLFSLKCQFLVFLYIAKSFKAGKLPYRLKQP